MSFRSKEDAIHFAEKQGEFSLVFLSAGLSDDSALRLSSTRMELLRVSFAQFLPVFPIS